MIPYVAGYVFAGTLDCVLANASGISSLTLRGMISVASGWLVLD